MLFKTNLKRRKRMGELRGMNLAWLKAISGQTNSIKYRFVFHLINQLTESN